MEESNKQNKTKRDKTKQNKTKRYRWNDTWSFVCFVCWICFVSGFATEGFESLTKISERARKKGPSVAKNEIWGKATVTPVGGKKSSSRQTEAQPRQKNEVEARSNNQRGMETFEGQDKYTRQIKKIILGIITRDPDMNRHFWLNIQNLIQIIKLKK